MVNFRVISMRYFVALAGLLSMVYVGGLESPHRNVYAQTLPTPEQPATPEGQSSPATTPANQQPSLQPSASASEYVRQGDRHYANADYDRAIASYTQSLDQYGQNAYAYYNRGNAYRQQRKYVEALGDYNLSLQLNPDNTFGYLYRGMVLKELGEHQVAVANYDEFIKRNDSNAAGYAERGELYHLLGDKQAALADLKKALDLYKRQEKYRNQRLVQKQIEKVKATKDKAN
jgi:tetratricopeptide (TPR) repeat protein